MRITTANARFQQWEALLHNRTKRHRLGQFLVHGVRPITLAVEHGWPVEALLRPVDRRLSSWATELIAGASAPCYELAESLLVKLSDREDPDMPELIAVVAPRPVALDRLEVRPDSLIVLYDRPTSPGNLGTVVRSADAFGAAAVIVTGHAADIYDPKTVRASTGSLFAVPVLASSTEAVLAWVKRVRGSGIGLRIVGTDESGPVPLSGCDLRGARLLVVGNETRGMSRAWAQACDEIAHIPIGGAASSLNAATAAGIVLYEATRQR